MIKNLLTLFILVCASASSVLCQGPANPAPGEIMLQLKDRADSGRTLTVREHGHFAWTNPVQVDGREVFSLRDCSLIQIVTRPEYRLITTGDVCKQTGKAVLQLFGVGTFTILDSTANAQDSN